MVQPAVRLRNAREAADAARALETPSEVEQFERLASDSAVLRAFLATPEWAEIRSRIVGNGRPPSGRFETLGDLARLFRWTADGAFSEEELTAGERKVYLHAAAEVDAFARRMPAPVSPAVYVEGLGGEQVAVPRPPARVAEAVSGLGFGEAMLAIQAGRHLARTRWEAGAYVTAQAGYPQGIGVNANTAAATGLAEGTVAEFAPYLMRCSYSDGRPSFEPWTPGQGDLFARDWRILPRPSTS